jgi:hypothetical protein
MNTKEKAVVSNVWGSLQTFRFHLLRTKNGDKNFSPDTFYC